MLPLRFFRSRAFAAGNARDLLHLRLAVRLRVPVRAVPADLARLRPAGTGLRLMPVDDHLHPRRAGCRRARRPDRRAAADVGGLALQAVGLVWLALIADAASPTRALGAVRRRRGRRLDGDPVRRRTRSSRGIALGRGRQGGGREQHDARARRGVRDRGRRRRLRRPRRATRRPGRVRRRLRRRGRRRRRASRSTGALVAAALPPGRPDGGAARDPTRAGDRRGRR